jgi:hypothetical protein
MDAALPWLISGVFHLGLLLITIFVAFLMVRAMTPDEAQVIVVPNAFEDPAYSEHPGGIPHPGVDADPTRESAQDKLRELVRSEGWAPTNAPTNVAGLLGGKTGDSDAVGIFGGSGGSLGGGGANSLGGSQVAAYGAPGGGMGIGPKSSFYGTGGNATRIVYILDHSGSMLDNFDFLKGEATKSVSNLVPLQYFCVILVSDKVSYVGASSLQRATLDVKKVFATQLAKEQAEGQNDDLLAPFQLAFERAFALKPQLIYFLTDGKFGEGLIKIVGQLNKDGAVRVNTIAFVTEEPSYKGQLQLLASQNGGVYKFIPEKDLGK